MKQKQESLARSAALLTVAGLVSQVLSFFYRVALTRMVGAELLGVQQIVLQVYAVLQSIALTGLTVAVSSLSAGYHALGNRRGATELLHLSIGTLGALWLPIAGAIIFYADELANFVLDDSRTRLSLFLLLPLLLLTGIENLNKHHFYGIQQTALPAAIELGEQLIRTVAILTLLSLFLPLDGEHTVALIFLGMLVSEVFSSLSLTILRRKREGPLRYQPGSLESPLALERRILKIALPISATAILDNLIEAANSILIPRELGVFGLSSTEAMELYGVVFGMTMPMLMLPFAFVRALSLALLPRITGYAATSRMKQLNETACRSVFITSVILLPVTALMVTVGRDLGFLLFRDARAGSYIIPLAFITSVTGLQSVLAAVLNGIGKQTQSALVSLACGMVQLSFTLFGVARFGMPACLAGMLLSGVAGLLVRLRLVHRATGFTPDLFLCLWAPGLGALLSGLCTNLLYQVMTDGGYGIPVSLCCCTALCAGLYLACLQAMGVHIMEKNSRPHNG